MDLMYTLSTQTLASVPKHVSVVMGVQNVLTKCD